MKIKNIKIYFIRKKKYELSYPMPTFHKEGFVFIKLISEENLEGFVEPSPYITNPKKLISIIKKIYLKYFQKKKLNISYVEKLKKKVKIIC